MLNPQLRTLIEVAEAGSFSKAADRLYLSAVSVMNQINALEERIGVKLFQRTNQGVALTEAGKSLYEDARRMTAESDAAIARARELAKATKATVRIGTSILRPCTQLMEAWAHAEHTDPSIQIRIVPFEDDPASLAVMAESLGRDIDCFVSPCDSVVWKKSYSIHPLGMCKCSIAVPRRHPLAERDMLCWDDLAGETLMLVKRGQSSVVDRIRDEIETFHEDVRIADTSGFYDMEAFNACEEHGCLMEVPDAWTDVHPSIATVPMDWAYEMPFRVVYARKPTAAFASFMRAVEGAKTQ